MTTVRRVHPDPSPRRRPGRDWTVPALLAGAALGLSCSREAADSAVPVGGAQSLRRIIAIAPNAAEIICELGEGKRLVAVDRFCKYPPEIAHLPRVGGLRDPDLETILALKPDLLIVRSGRDETLARFCRRNGIRFYRDQTDTLADIERTVLELGELLDRQDRARAVVGRMRRGLAAVREAVSGRPRPRVLFTNRQPDALANIYTVSKGSYLNDLIAVAGGTNVFGELDGAYPLVSVEEIFARKPEVIIESLFGAADSPELRRTVAAQWSAVGRMPAVRDGRIHLLVEDYATIPSPRVVRMASDLAALIHPEVSLD